MSWLLLRDKVILVWRRCLAISRVCLVNVNLKWDPINSIYHIASYYRYISYIYILYLSWLSCNYFRIWLLCIHLRGWCSTWIWIFLHSICFQAGCWLWDGWLCPRLVGEHWIPLCSETDPQGQGGWIILLGITMWKFWVHGPVIASTDSSTTIWMWAP